jgi:hypothetical protein
MLFFQDMIVNRLEDKESKLREDISLFDSQLNNQSKYSSTFND